MRVLITGITGFTGSHLGDYLLTVDGIEIFGIERWRSKTENIEHIRDRIMLYECDVRDASSVRKVIETIRPDRIFHLAAQSFVPTSWKVPQETLTTNIIGELNIFETCLQAKINPFILIAGSSEEYGLVYEDEAPIKETNPLRPLSPYAVSKVGQNLLGYQYFKSYGLNIIRCRAFNHTGPRRGEVFCSSDFAKQIASIEAGLVEPVVRVGNLEAKRDFTDVRDIVKAYWLATEKCEPGEVYNISSNKAYSIREVLDMLIDLAKVEVKVEKDPLRMRPSDVPLLLGDNTKFVKKTGWRPKIPLEQTLKDLLDYWRQKITAGYVRAKR